MAAQVDTGQYTRVAALLHWTLAILIIVNLWIGLNFDEAGVPGGNRLAQLNLHISLGVLILLLSVARLAWRIYRKPPEHPHSMAKWEVNLANLGHTLFYVFMIGLPITGWLVISANKPYPFPQMLFDTVELPRLSALHLLSDDAIVWFHDAVALVHNFSATWLMLGLLALHIGAILKHEILDKERTMSRMWPFRRRRGA